MALTVPTITRDVATNAVVDTFDGGTLEFQHTAASATAGANEVATCTFGTPAFGASSAVATGRADANAIGSDTNAAGGTVGFFTIFSSGAANLLQGTVTLTGGSGDIFLSSLTVGATDTVTMSTLTFTTPAS